MWKKIMIISGSVLGILLIAAGAYTYHLYSSVKQTADGIYEPVESQHDKQPREEPEPVDEDEDPDPISILLMGVDERKHDVGRSDTLIVMTLNPRNHTMQMVSIPRDTRTEIIGRGTVDKINHAYAFGGTEMAMNTVEHFLDIPLDYYIRMNMEGLSDLVDAVGGITVHNDLSWYDRGRDINYHKGELHLNGPEALGFVRMRYQDPRGDFGRNERQRKVITAIIDQAADVSSFTRYSDILQAISDNVKTNITFDEMKYIAMNYRSSRNNVKTYAVKGNGTRIGGIYYLLVSDEERRKVHEMVMEQLRKDDEKTKAAAEG